VNPDNDPFADALESYWRKGRGSYRYTREDGWSQVEDAWWYFTRYRDFLTIEKQALRFARGHILDVGCGAGRHSLYLQRKGLEVTSLDVSPRVAAIARAQGVRRACVASGCANLPFHRGQFDTILLFGNNFGICGGLGETANLLQEIARVASPRGRILTTTRAPAVSTKRDLDYLKEQLARGREFDVARFRLDFRGKHPKWVSLLLLSPPELIRLAWDNGWVVARIFGEASEEEGYAAVLEKRKIVSSVCGLT
jgi:SAM-dependent methyltransferase